MNIAREIISAVARRLDDEIFVENPGMPERRTVSGTEFLRLVREFGAAFGEHRIGAGSRVAICLPNSVAFAAVVTALLERDAVFCPVKLEFRVSELSSIFADFSPDAVVVEQAHIATVAPFLVGRTVLVRTGDSLLFAPALSMNATAAPNRPVAGVAPEPDAPLDLPTSSASVNFTYRGIGYPLGAIVPHARYASGARTFFECTASHSPRRLLVALPMSHIFGLIGCVFVPLLYGVTAVIARSLNPRRVFSVLSTEKIDFFPTIPEILDLLARFAPADARDFALTILATGGSRLTEHQYTAFRTAFAADVVHGYGLTECTPVSRNFFGSTRAGTIGEVADDIELSLDPVDGEILLRGRDVFSGYYRRADETRDACTTDGRFRTGDLGQLRDGHLVFRCEKKRTCKANGLLVDLREIELVLEQHDSVASASAVFDSGDILVTVEPSESGTALPAAALTEYLRFQIAPYKIPKRIS
ncbi:MAG: long-chain fatty acid--CoA ligase [Spirochaetaceae bacterium]|nr:MAG: long-chain fatty acid--CoA ligase [Spirochaetaceae bacterium]